jgi:hypothetical protein
MLFCSPLIYANPVDTLLKNNIASISFPGLQIDPAYKDSSSFTLPFSKAGNLILIKAKADTTEGNFILDTGCPGLALNSTYFRSYNVTTETGADNEGITGNTGAAENIEINSFQMGSMQEYKVKASLANLGTIENSKGVKIIGLIGMQFLADCELIIDYQTNLLHFHLINKKEMNTYRHVMLADTAAYYTLPFDITDKRIIIKTTMVGKKLRFVIDCAAETNILDSRLPDKILEGLSITGRISLVGVGNKKVEAVRGSLASFAVGERIIKDMPVLVTNLEKTCFAQGGCVDGVLGLDNLSVKKIGFNFAKHKMYIWK